MSTTLSPPPTPATHYYLTNLGLGYAIAIAFGFIVLFSSLLLVSYICFRHRYNNGGPQNDGGVILPSIIFVDETNENDGDDSNCVVGLDESVINSYPKFAYSVVAKSGVVDTDTVVCCCAICLCEYKQGEMMRMLPDCKHSFHMMCVDAWLRLNASCPVCRNSPLPTPLSTPLAEVVPLSQYSDGRRRR